MKQFQVINREYIPEFNLELYGNMLEKRSTLHNEAVKANSELKNTIAQLNLNEAEDGFRAKLIADVQKTLTENASLGDYAASYDDMIRVSGDIVSNPALISKLKAQQDYQTFQAKIDARTDLPQHYKDYFKAQNKYYEGEYDANGNWIKGTKWEPTKTAAVSVDINKIWEEALKRISPDKGTFQINTWIDANRNVVDKYQPNAKLVRYNTATYTYEEVKKEDIKAAIDEVIKANPIYMDSLKQDWEIAKYDLLHGNKDAVFDVNNGTGGPITFNQFVDRLFDESARTKAYRYTEWKKDDFNKNLHKELEVLNGSGQTNYTTSPFSPYTNIGETSVYKDNSNVINFANIRKGNDDLKKELKNLGYVPDNIISQANLSNFDTFAENINKLYDNGTITNEQWNEALRIFHKKEFEYKEEIHNNRKFNDSQKGTKAYDATEFYADFLYGQFKDESERSRFYNRLTEEWSAVEHGLFGENGEALYIQFGNNRSFDIFQKLLEENAVSDYVDIDKGNNGVTINRSHNNMIPIIASLYQQSIDKGYEGQPLKKLWNRIKGSNSNSGDIVYRVNEDGTYFNLNANVLSRGNPEELLFGTNINPETIMSRNIFGRVVSAIPVLTNIQNAAQNGLIYDSRDVFDPILRFTDRINNYTNKHSIEEVPIYNLSYNAGTVEGIVADARIRKGDYEDLTERNALEKQVFDSKKALFNQVKASGLYGMEVKMQDENGLMIPVIDQDKLVKIQNALVRADPSNDQNLAIIEFDKTTGRYVAKLKFVEKVDDKTYNPYILYLDDRENNYISELNNDPIMIGYGKINRARMSNQDIFLGTFNGTDIFAQPVEGGTAFKITDDTLSENWNIIRDKEIAELQQIAYYNELFNIYGEKVDLTQQVLQYLPHMAHILGIDLEDKSSCMKILNSLNDNFGIVISKDIINQIWEQ